MTKISLIVTTTFGLEAVVKRELENLGFYDFLVADGKIEFQASIEDIPKLNIRLRCADRVLIKMGEFEALDFGQLFDQTKVLPWENWIPKNAKLTVIGKCVRSKLESVRSCQSIAHKAVIERLKEKWNVTWLDETGPEFTIQVAMLKDMAQLTIDTSGLGLHKRGYRKEHGEVPIRENLAAALVLLSSWKKESLLIDPMCGSGTILIEAAMIGRNIAPGLKRDFVSETWSAIDKKFWIEARAEATEAIRPSGSLNILGYDIDQDRIADSKINAKNAGVDQDIVFKVQDIRSLKIDQDSGTVISNPPYGIKLFEPIDIPPLYKALDALFSYKLGWAVYIITADADFPKYFKRCKPNKVRKLFNGTIQVNYYQYYAENNLKLT